MGFKRFGYIFEVIIFGNIEPNCGVREFSIDVDSSYR